MFYKIIQNNQIIDVNNQFFKAQEKPHLLVPCEPKYCEYICSSDGVKFYYSDWTRESNFPFSFPERVDQIIIIDEEEYNSLKEQLNLEDDGKLNIIETTIEPEVVDVQTLEEPIEETQQVEVLTNAELRRRVLELEQLVQQLLKK